MNPLYPLRRYRWSKTRIEIWGPRLGSVEALAGLRVRFVGINSFDRLKNCQHEVISTKITTDVMNVVVRQLTSLPLFFKKANLWWTFLLADHPDVSWCDVFDVSWCDVFVEEDLYSLVSMRANHTWCFRPKLHSDSLWVPFPGPFSGLHVL